MNALKLMLAGGVLAVVGSAASAATCTYSASPSTTYTLEASGAAACVGGNDTNTVDESSTYFGLTGWTLADKSDDTDSGDGAISFVGAPVDGSQSGAWSISNPSGYTSVMITLKAGPSFAAFLLDNVEAFLAGTWATSRDLSHASIYYTGEPGPAPVPLPAAGLLLLGGLGTMAAVRRRKKA